MVELGVISTHGPEVGAESWERVRREGVREGGWPIRQVRVGGTRRPGLRQAEVVIRFDTAQ